MNLFNFDKLLYDKDLEIIILKTDILMRNNLYYQRHDPLHFMNLIFERWMVTFYFIRQMLISSFIPSQSF